MTIRYDRPFTCSHRPQPGLVILKDYTLARWGGINGGIDDCRDIREGTTLSVHAEGRANDWQQSTRAVFLDAFNFVVINAEALQVQRATDYLARRSWDCRLNGGRGGFEKFSGYGAGWLPNWHVERNWDGARDSRSIESIVGMRPHVDEEPDVKPSDITSVLLVGRGRKKRTIKVTREGGIICPEDLYEGAYTGLRSDLREHNRNFYEITARPDGGAGYTLWADDGAYYSFGRDSVAFLRPETVPKKYRK